MFTISRRSDIILALLVLMTSAMLLVPLPTFLLDFLITLNLCISLLLLLVGLYMPNPLALLSFPSLLLLTTLFRLGLNVASSRLILSRGEAGEVIEAFGTLLIRGEIVVGLIIFSIVTIVNFIVIARGSARVSEVAARFALDALPGKQMAIDSDLKAGIISPEQARIRREELRKESQLYGSMDGAMRFVQGDAVAGVCIIFVNIIGGIYLGIAGGLGFQEALETYTTLTVGDGLVTQIPALLVSICAGVVVTRVASGENTTLGVDLGAQLFARPGTIYLAGGVLGFIGLLPGLPLVPFVSVALLATALGYSVQKGRFAALAATGRLEYSPTGTPLIGSTSSEDSGPEDYSLQLRLDVNALYKGYRGNAARYQGWWKELQSDFYEEFGVRLPELSVVADDTLSPSSFALSLSGTPIDRGQVILDSLLVEARPETAASLGLKVVRTELHPLWETNVFWTGNGSSQRKILDAAEVRTYDFFEYITLRLSAFFLRNSEEVLSLTDVYFLLKGLEKKYPGLVEEALNKNFIDTSRLTELLQELVREGVGIRDFRAILESVATYCSLHRGSLSEGDQIEVADLLSFVRQSRRRQLVSRYLTPRRSLKAIFLDPVVEEIFERVGFDGTRSPLALEPDVARNLMRGFEDHVRSRKQSLIYPLVILVRGELRPKVSAFLRGVGWYQTVLAFEELEPNLDIEQLGSWSPGAIAGFLEG